MTPRETSPIPSLGIEDQENDTIKATQASQTAVYEAELAAISEKREEIREKYISDLQSANSKTREELDKSLITLSTFIIGFLLTFRQQVFTKFQSFGFPWQLWVPLGLLIMCITLVLISHFVSVIINNRIIDTLYDDGDFETAFKNVRYVEGLNILSATVFVLGIIFSVLFIAGAADGKM